MSTIAEKYAGVSASEKRIDVVFQIQGTTDEVTALADLKSFAPSTRNGLTRKAEEIKISEVADSIWEGTVPYVENEENNLTFSFETGGATVNIQHALETTNQYSPDGEQDTDFKGAINVTKDSKGMPKVAGVSVVIPALTLTTKKTFDPVDVDNDKIKMFAEMTGSTNDGAFRGFAEGELLLTSVSGSLESEEAFPVTFKFQASENAEDQTVGGIENVDKKGHEYLWVNWETVEDDNAKALTPQARDVVVNKVYPDKNFGDLELED